MDLRLLYRLQIAIERSRRNPERTRITACHCNHRESVCRKVVVRCAAMLKHKGRLLKIFAGVKPIVREELAHRRPPLFIFFVDRRPVRVRHVQPLTRLEAQNRPMSRILVNREVHGNPVT